MEKTAFYHWLVKNGMKESSAKSRIKNCIQVCKYEGDLDMLYEQDGCRNLLYRLTYTKEDERNQQAPKHLIPINGNIYNGTATYKGAVHKYLEFRYSLLASVSNLSPAPSVNKSSSTSNSQTKTLKNKDFASTAAKILSHFPQSFTTNDIQLLTDSNFCHSCFNCNFPILKEISTDLHESKNDTHIDGYRRYYSDVSVNHSGHCYLVSNDWYQNDAYSNRNLFSDWLLSKLVG